MHECILVAWLMAAVTCSVGAEELKIKTVKDGNIFVTGEPVTVSVEGAAETVTWTATDLWGRMVGSGTVAAKDGVVTLPELRALGYYDVALAAGEARGVTRVAILAPFDLAKVPDSPFGTMTHFSAHWNVDLIPTLMAIGVKNFRDEIFWGSIEQQRGEFVFPEKFERYVALLRKHQINHLVPLSFGNKLYDHGPKAPGYGWAPFTDEGIAGYARYAQEVVKHYGARIMAVEMWNEYNGSFGQGPAQGKATAYARMLVPTYEAIKQVAPELPVLGCDTIGLPLGWIEEVLKNGGATHMDGISVHPYGYLSQPESHIPAIEALHELVRKYNNGKTLPLWVTEQGYYLTTPGAVSERINGEAGALYTTTPGEQGNREAITELTKAKYLVRAYVVFWAHGVAKTFWYLSRNDQAFGTMGLVGSEQDAAGKYAVLPAAVAFGVMSRELTGWEFAGQDTAPAGVHSYGFKRAGERQRVMWSPDKGQVVALPSDQPLTVTDLMGEAREVHPVNGSVHVYLSDAPLYVRGVVASVSAATAFRVSAPEFTATGESFSVQVKGPENDYRWAINQPATDGVHAVPLTVDAGGKMVLFGILKANLRPALWLDSFLRMNQADELQAVLVNTSREKSYRVVAASYQLDGKSYQTKLDQTIVANSTVTLTLKTDPLPAFTIRPAAVELTLASGATYAAKSNVSHNPLAKRTISGARDWDDLGGINLSEGRYVKLEAARKDAADLSGTLKLCWDDQNVYLLAQIRDDVFFQDHTGYSTWKGDNLQIAFSQHMPWTGGEWGIYCQGFNLALTKDGPEVYRTHGPRDTTTLPKVPLTVTRAGDLTTYQCAIPWSELAPLTPASGAFSFGIFINDNDGEGRKGYLQWADTKSLNAMQPFILKK
ncbi:MAG: hypothetical protein LBK60_04035 [Verrucomicrobiales bacterium]|jgi:hypothetical protein|nr:hypothetical protein [Verrucomicrobiales bacterium]